MSDRIPLRIEEIRLDPGDRFPLTVDADGMPSWWPNLYCSIALRTGGMGLIAENQTRRAQHGWPEGCEFPLFRRTEPDPERLAGPQHEFAMHMSPKDITRMLTEAIAKLQIVSHRTGKPLVVNMRRFRRTYGTRAVEEGASPSELAVMLDHSDLGSVQAYFETRANRVRRLDAALAMHLAPIADAFMGRIVSSERDAVNGTNPAKRIPWYRRHADRLPEKSGHLGTCGSGPCGLFAPISC